MISPESLVNCFRFHWGVLILFPFNRVCIDVIPNFTIVFIIANDMLMKGSLP